MAKFYELALHVQIRRLCTTGILFLLAGGYASYELAFYHHLMWAFLIAVIALQAATGSFIIMSDLKKDLQDQKKAA
ncbi:MAG: hypothetical protein KGI37_09620 [Alphaproteobacteria bacterium]|nr:hypothetical protein [Alphaproteobacteria bacterium]